MRNAIIYSVLIGIIIVLLFRSCSDENTSADVKEVDGMYKAKYDSLKTVIDEKTGLADNSKAAYVGTDENVKKFIQDNDAELAKISKNNKGSKAAIVEGNNVRIDTIVKVVHDTVPGTKDDVRTADINTPHYDAHIVSTPEQMRLSLLLRDKVTYVLGADNRIHAQHSIPPDILQVTELNGYFVEPRQKKKNGKWIGGALIGAAAVAIGVKVF